MLSPAILSTLALAAWLLTASATDVRTRRIPNELIVSGMLCGLAVQALAPRGDSLFASAAWGSIGLTQSLLGLAAGLALFMPFYALRAMGAGDVKLLAMVGVWLGPKLLLGATLLTMLAGGVLAVVLMLATRSSRQVLANVRCILTTSLIGAQAGRLAPFDAPAPGGAQLPYGLAIAIGTLAQVGWLLMQAHA